ncbi:MAG: type II toxin-antitoxin system CcdA family antitoxin [Panacagrimonas sp.]
MPASSVKSPTGSPAKPARPGARRRVNLSLSANILDDARALGLNISRIADDTLAAAVREEKARRWAEDNRAAIEHHTRRIERSGMWNKDLVRF